MNRRKKKPSSEPWLRTKVSGILKNGITQLNQPLGRAGAGCLQWSVKNWPADQEQAAELTLELAGPQRYAVHRPAGTSSAL